MNLERQVNKANQLLKQELGSSPTGMPNFEWKYSESWQRSMRVVDVVAGQTKPRYEPELNPVSGLFEMKPVYITRKVCEELNCQWVMTRWMATGNFQEWRALYNDDLEWPKGGEYFPVTAIQGNMPGRLVALVVGESPDEHLSWKFIHVIRKDQQDLKDFEQVMQAKLASKERADTDRMIGQFMNKLPVHLNVPGSRDFGVWSGTGHDVDPRTSWDGITDAIPAIVPNTQVGVDS